MGELDPANRPGAGLDFRNRATSGKVHSGLDAMHKGYVYGYPDLPSVMDGFALLVDKPQGWSSFDVVRRLRRLLLVKKIGHAGTLDPMATGLLICLVGKGTKWMEAFMEQTKAYSGTLRLGEITTSYDAETEVVEKRHCDHITESNLETVRKSFEGSMAQQPPMYSAVKVEGERLYKKARRGETIERPSRQVVIYRFDITAYHRPDVSFEVDCSKGTYIRTLAHDFGQRLGCGAHLTALRRDAIGAYHVRKAWSLDLLEQALGKS